MNKKISKKELDELIDQVREETKIDFAKRLEEVIGPNRSITLDEYVQEIVPKLLSTTFTYASFHAEYLIHDVLSKLDLLTDDSQID